MSDERERGGGSDGLLVGVLVLLVALLLGGLGLGFFSFRYVRVERERAMMLAEQARAAEMEARMVAEENARLAEQARKAADQSQSESTQEPQQDDNVGTNQPPSSGAAEAQQRDQPN